MNVTLGGDRLGSGNKNKQHLHNYFRSTHNLSERFSSTMGCGMLIPCLVKPALRGDVFDININASARTLPTQSPLFSTFKMQVDILFSPVRLYQGILHNNPLFIGLNMENVKFPKMELTAPYVTDRHGSAKMANNCLLKYLGLSGLGSATGASGQRYKRLINAIPMLAYYDIAKCYYANKQEEKAYYLSSHSLLQPNYFKVEKIQKNDITLTPLVNTFDINGYKTNRACDVYLSSGDSISMKILTDSWGTIYNKNSIYIKMLDYNEYSGYPGNPLTLAEAEKIGFITDLDISTTIGQVEVTFDFDRELPENWRIMWEEKEQKYKDIISINDFKLDTIDKMRLNLLSHHTLGEAYIIDKDYTDKPFKDIVGYDGTTGISNFQHELNGIMLKTYQADLFNAWINTEWLDGENGIAEMSKIAVSDGSVYMDAFLLAEKTYNMLNRIAVAGGTYEAWQDVVYQESSLKQIETPIFCGGVSEEIVFEEIVQTTPTESAPLGTLGGRGIAVKRKGGHVSIKVDEAGFVMGIVSITPRIYYTQGNEFYLTELDSMNDFHKPALDGIGFQDLLGERMCWSDTKLNQDGTIYSRTKVGKLPAWIEYMTAVDKAYGEFCDLSKQGSMILGRHYKTNTYGEVQDFTTYIDPAKYNYAFGNASLTAQNFWVQIDFDIKARRLMSAKQIPNL